MAIPEKVTSSENPSFEWNLTIDTIKPIEMTVALPVYQAKHSIWFALESLRRQTKIYFGWELIIQEEHGSSVQIVKNFINRLPNCQRILYQALNPNREGRKSGPNQNKILLIDKWVWMCQLRSPTSKIYVMQSADDYSPTKRLATHYNHFTTNSKCIFSTQHRGLFFNIFTNKRIVYNGTTLPKARTHLNMAYRMKYFSKVHNRTEKTRGIDSYIRMTIETESGHKFNPNQICYLDQTEPGIWKTGFFTDGCNTISKSRKKFYLNIKPPYVRYDPNHGIWERIPEPVLSYLKALHSFLNKKTTVPPAIPHNLD